MIRELRGDILLSEAEAIVVGVSPNDHFDQGLSLALRERWPAMSRDYRHWAHNRHPKPGSAWIWSGPQGKRIICLVIQDDENHTHTAQQGKSRLEYVNHALRELRSLVQREGLASVAIPKLASGSGRLNWSEVKSLIDNHLADCGAQVAVYSDYVPDLTANEHLVAANT